MRAAAAVFFALLVLPGIVGAIGISPPKAQINFAPDLSGDFSVLVMNSRAQAITAETRVTGDLAQYFHPEEIVISARGRETATIEYALPEDIEPGMHRQVVWFTEAFPDENQGTFPAKTEVGLIIDVWKPYPGKYAEIQVTPQHARRGEDTQASLDVWSRGDQPLRGDIILRITSSEGRLMDSITLADFEIDADSHRERNVFIESRDWPPGKYSVRAEYDYGAGVAEDEQTLKMGTRTLEIVNVTTDYYKDTPVNRFTITVESLWNEPLPEVSASLQLGKNTGRTPSVTLPGFESKELTGYWETDATLSDGEQPALVTVTFRDGEDVIDTFPVQVHNETPRGPQEEEPVVVIGMSELWFFILLVIVLISFFAYKAKEHRRRL